MHLTAPERVIHMLAGGNRRYCIQLCAHRTERYVGWHRTGMDQMAKSPRFNWADCPKPWRHVPP